MIPQRLAALRREMKKHNIAVYMSLIHISEPTRLALISYAVF